MNSETAVAARASPTTGVPAVAPSLRHWSLARDADGIAWLTLDKAGATANTLSSDVLLELGSVLDALDRDPPQGLVIRSGKESGFIAGADVDEFAAGADIEASARAIVTRGLTLFDRL